VENIALVFWQTLQSRCEQDGLLSTLGPTLGRTSPIEHHEDTRTRHLASLVAQFGSAVSDPIDDNMADDSPGPAEELKDALAAKAGEVVGSSRIEAAMNPHERLLDHIRVAEFVASTGPSSLPNEHHEIGA
jgi:hypothetical protein